MITRLSGIDFEKARDGLAGFKSSEKLSVSRFAYDTRIYIVCNHEGCEMYTVNTVPMQYHEDLVVHMRKDTVVLHHMPVKGIPLRVSYSKCRQMYLIVDCVRELAFMFDAQFNTERDDYDDDEDED